MARGQSNPAPGARDRINGVMTNVGNTGFSWSSTVNSFNGVYLSLSVTDLNPSYSNHRALGFQLRCLSE